MRNRPLTRFAAPLVVVVAACGENDGPPPEDTVPDAWFLTENPPSPWLGLECWVQPPFQIQDSPAVGRVCTYDPSCCTDRWDEHCAELTAVLGDVPVGCGSTIVTLSGNQISTTLDPTAEPVTLPADGAIRSIALRYGRPRWQLDVAVAGDCYGRIFEDRRQGPELDPVLTETFAHEPLDCHLGAPATRFEGTRVRWADIDGNLLVDAIFAGSAGVWWATRASGEVDAHWTFGADVLSADAGGLSDFTLVDVDRDADLDLIATFADGPARLYRQAPDHSFEVDPTWTSLAVGHLRIETCPLVGDERREIVLTGPSATEAYQLDVDGIGAPVFAGNGIVPGVGPANQLTCGRLDLWTDSLVLVGVDGAVRVVDETGLVWDSSSNLDPPYTVNAVALDVRHGFDSSSIVIAVAGESGHVPYVLLVPGSPNPITEGIDHAPDRATTAMATSTLSP